MARALALVRTIGREVAVMLGSFMRIQSTRAAPAKELWIAHLSGCGQLPIRDAALVIDVPGLVRRNAARQRESAAFVALCGETPAKSRQGEGYEVQARQRRAYSPPASTSS